MQIYGQIKRISCEKKLSLHNGKANFARAQHALDLEFFTVEYSKVSNKRTCTIRIFFFEKSQKKNSPFFPVPQKLFLLIHLKNESLYEVKYLNKVINRNNFYGSGKKWGIFICEF